MITNDQIPTIVGRELISTEGDRIGQIEQVYLDGTTSRPEWLYVKTNRLTGKKAFVPAATVQLLDEKAKVDLPKETVRHAPHVDTDPDGLLPYDQGTVLYDHYGHPTPAAETVNDIPTSRPNPDDTMS